MWTRVERTSVIAQTSSTIWEFRQTPGGPLVAYIIGEFVDAETGQPFQNTNWTAYKGYAFRNETSFGVDALEVAKVWCEG